jgi:cytochrome c553
MSKGIRAGMLGVGVIVGVAGLLAQSATAPKPAAAPAADAAKIARGKYLMTVGACNDCHSPKLDPQQHPDPKRPFSGRPQTTQAPSQNPNEIHASLDLTAWAGPWGVSYGANLSPDPETGLKKRYTEASFIKTLRTGKKPEGEDLLPPMPWELYKVFSDEDIKAIWAYLQTIPAIKNNVKSAAPVLKPAAAPAKK